MKSPYCLVTGEKDCNSVLEGAITSTESALLTIFVILSCHTTKTVMPVLLTCKQRQSLLNQPLNSRGIIGSIAPAFGLGRDGVLE